CTPLERTAMRQMMGDEIANITLGTHVRAADVQLLVGYPGSHAALRQTLHSGAKATLLVLGELPYEYTLARLPQSLLSDPPPVWLPSPTNAYVYAQHLLCAASELPLTQAEVEAWQVQEIVERLERHGQLVSLPDEQPAWQPVASATTDPLASDPYH